MRHLALALLLTAACGGDKAKPPPDAAPPPPPRLLDAAPPIDAAPVDPGVREEGQVRKGDMIIKIFKRHGVVGEEANQVIQAMKGSMDFKKMQPGQKYSIVHRDGRLLAFELQLTETSKVKVVRGADDKITVSVE